MSHNKIAPVLLGALLAASLTPAGADAAGGQTMDAAASAAAQNAEDAAENNAIDASGDAAGSDIAGNDGEHAHGDNAESNTEDVIEDGAGNTVVNDANLGTEDDTENDAVTPESVGDVAATIVRGNDRITFSSLNEAVEAAQDGDVIELSCDLVLDRQIVISGNIELTLRAIGDVTLTRSPTFSTTGSKVAGMIKLDGGAQLILEGSGDTGSLTLDGEGKDSDDAIITLRNGAKLTMNKGASIVRAHCSWKPWGAVYVHSGTFVLNGGEIRGGRAMKNAAVAVEHGSTFEMRDGLISNNHVTYSETIVWTKGDVRMTGGVISNNSSNVANDAVVQVLSGGSFAFEGGVIGDNDPNSTFGMLVEKGGVLTLDAGAHFAGTDRIKLAQGASLHFAGTPLAHSIDNPIEIVLSGTWDDGAQLATTGSEQIARDVRSLLSVKRGGAIEQMASVGIDPGNPANIALASSEVAASFAALDNPFEDNLGLTLRTELSEPDALDRLRNTVETYFGDVETPEKRVRLEQIAHLENYIPYHKNHHGTISASVIELSELGNPGAEAQRTKQGYQFDNLDATGFYLKPGEVHEIVVYVDAVDPAKLSVAWREAGITGSNSYTALNLSQRSGLANGVNRIIVDMTGKTQSSMLFVRNDSNSNPARVRIEAADASDPVILGNAAADSSPLLGSSLGEHPFYEHDPAHPERFWTFVQDIKTYAEHVRNGHVADMTLLQMGNDGHAQFSLRATVLAKAYAGITTEEEAIAYIKRSNEAVQKRLEFFWAFDGYDRGATGPNAVSPARVHTAFTSTVTSPSTLYAYARYYHMPEEYVEPFLSGDNMYSWGMSHEYGHMLDNSVIAVGEETNNLYSIAGSRQGGIEKMDAEDKAFVPREHYHGNVIEATKRRDQELAAMAADLAYVPDWMNDDTWGTYIWTHVTTWWNGLHFFDDWDYSDYDFENSPYTNAIAEDVKRYGAYGASVRILRSDADAVKTITDLASHAATDKSVKYNRIAVAFTMGTGYNFAEYLYELGERDLAPEVLEWCKQYPSMPRAVRYFSIDTDAAIINGAKTYDELEGAADAVAPKVSVEMTENGRVSVRATMASDELTRATTAFELYRGGALIGFSRDGSFEVDADVGAPTDAATDDEAAADTTDDALDREAYTVVAYDVRVNPSRAANVNGPVADVETPDEEEGEQPDGGENGGTDGNQPGNGGEDGDNGDGEDGDTEQPGDGNDGSGDNNGSQPDGDTDNGDSDGSGDNGSGQPDNGDGDGQPDGGDNNDNENRPGGDNNLPGGGSVEEQPGDGDEDASKPEEDNDVDSDTPDGDNQPGDGGSDDAETPEGDAGSDDDSNNPDGDNNPDDEQPDGEENLPEDDDTSNGDADGNQPDTDTPDAGENLPDTGGNGIANDGGTSGNGNTSVPGNGSEGGGGTSGSNGSTGPHSTGNTGSTSGNVSGQKSNGSAVAGSPADKLAQTGDSSPLLAGIAAIGSAIAFLGAAIVRRRGDERP